MAFGTSQALTAKRLIAKSGQDITFTRTVVTEPGVVDFELGGVDGGASTEDGAGVLTWTGKGIRSGDYTGINFENMGESVKEAFLAGKTLNMIVAAEGLEHAPEAGDILTLADETNWSILGISKVDPAGVPIIYFLGGVEV
jgi:hypothetical protein